MSPITISLAILLVTILLFIWEPVPIVVTAIASSIAYAYTGIIPVRDVFAGYNSNIIVLLAAMMVVGSSLFHTGITDIIGKRMVKITGKSERNIILVTLIVSCFLSSICSNIGVIVSMAPLVTAMCLSADLGPSKTLLALLFGSQFGGFVTLVGVGSNAAAAGVMANLGYVPFGFFAITPFGVGVCIVGTIFFAFVGAKYLPDTGYVPEFAQIEKKPFNKKCAIIACLTMAAVLTVIAMAPKAIPMHIAAVVGALVIVGTRCMTIKDAIHAIDWNCLILVGALSAMSAGIKASGAGNVMANLILEILGEHPSSFAITTVIFFTTTAITQVMSNIPTILVFLPIGMSIAESIGVSPYPIAMIITLAGAASYATPFAAPQNMMTVGWTNYKFIDFMKIGVPMILLTYLVILVTIPFVLPY
nr:SLC13 family permease [uncultured Dethiosulfovibrio sp.]